jgi:uncharacterized protein YbjT (DUF2867 family)
MKVLLLGETGFLGRHIAQALVEAGHEVASPTPPPGETVWDMAQALNPADWMPHLVGVGAVINAVGVLRDTRRRPMWPIHADAPTALFRACANAGVRRVIQVSALGVAHNPTAYARSKRLAEAQLMAAAQGGALSPVVLRPSIVVGAGGASTALFGALSALPWLLLPEPVAKGLVQPVGVDDLAEGCARLLGAQADITGVVAAVGPEVFSVEALIASWREARGAAPARVAHLPARLSRWSARLADCVPVTPWGSETLALLSQPNTASADGWAGVLGRAPVSVRAWPQEGVQYAC